MADEKTKEEEATEATEATEAEQDAEERNLNQSKDPLRRNENLSSSATPNEAAAERLANSQSHPSSEQEQAARESQSQRVQRVLTPGMMPDDLPRTVSQEAAGVPSPMPSANDIIIDGLPFDPAVMRDSHRPELAMNSGELAEEAEAEATAEHARVMRSAGA